MRTYPACARQPTFLTIDRVTDRLTNGFPRPDVVVVVGLAGSTSISQTAAMRGRKRTPFVTTSRIARGRERVMTESAALPLAVEACLDVIARHRAAGEPLDRVAASVGRERRLGPRERRATADLAFAWARHRAAVEKLLESAAGDLRGLAVRRRSLDLAAVLLAALAGGSNDVSAVAVGHFVIDERATAGLPDFLKALVDDAIEHGLHLPTSLPLWLQQEFERAFPGQGASLVDAVASPARPVIAVDTRKVSLKDAAHALELQGVTTSLSTLSDTALRADAGRLSLPKLPGAVRAAVWPMDDGSQFVAHAVGAVAGERVLDLCAGGGGKSRLLAQSGATVIAVDVDAGRLERSLPKGVQGVVADGRRPPFRKGSFDRVLVDAPCSGTGTLRRAPDLAARLNPADVPLLVELQTQLLASALSLVKPGGLVVYATCSLLQQENEGVVDAIVKAGGATRVADDRHLLPPLSDGFFVARLQSPKAAST